MDFSVASDEPAVGQPVDIVVTVQNQGTDAFYGPLQPGVGLYFDVTPTDCATQVVLPDWGQTLASLDIGETAYYTFTKIFDYTPVELYAAVDYGCLVSEPSEEGNAAGPLSLVMTDTVKPDLKITNVSWAPIDPAAGQPIAFDLFVTNVANAEGDVNAIASTSNLGLYIDPGHVPTCADTALRRPTPRCRWPTWGRSSRSRSASAEPSPTRRSTSCT